MKQKKQYSPLIKILGFTLWALLCFYASQIIIALPMRLILGDQISTPFWTFVFDLLFYAASIVLTVLGPVWFFKHKPSTRESLGLKDLPTWSDIGLAVVGFIVYMVLVSIVLQLLSGVIDINQAQNVGFDHYIIGIDRFLAFISLVVIAPIAEEILFRGWLYKKLRSAISHRKLSIFVATLVTSIIFGFLHGQLNVGINVFVMSIIMCLMRELTGTIYGSIIMHMIKNAVAFYMLYIML